MNEISASPARWDSIEHTADLAIEVRAPDRQALFLAAADGLVGLLCGRESSSDAEAQATSPEGVAEWRDLEVEAPDDPTLLVDWLRELLWIQSSGELRYVGAAILELEDGRLSARAGFRPPEPGEIERELKGVTYHDLEVRPDDGGWYARIVFDV